MMGILLAAAVAAETVACGGAHPPTVLPALVPKPRVAACTGGTYRHVTTNGWSEKDWYDFDRLGLCLAETPTTCRTDDSLPHEGYRLEVRKDGVTIVSADPAGEFYARQTLRQLATLTATNAIAIPCCTIEDSPQYRWRGMLLDEARHFFGKEIVKRQIDLMAQHKMNVLHWHLTDDQGWRLDIPGHPELVKFGAVRPRSVAFGSHARWLPPEKRMEQEYNTEAYGPYFYTPEDVREVLAYARERHVTVVPEIELPGHVRAFLAAHPECSCRGADLPRIPRCGNSVEEEVLCVGSDETVRLYEEILDRVCELFPDSPFVHIGGDECPRVRWKACPKCQARMKAEGLKDENGLQAWITGRMVRHLEAKGRRAVGWDEVLAGDVPASTVGMTWRSSAKGGAGNNYVSAAEAVRRGHDMVLSPGAFCYLDKKQGLRDDPYPYYSPWPGTEITLEKAYSFDPSAGIAAEDRGHVLGGQANLWTESTFNVFDLDWKTWPRACAIAEVLWLGDAKPSFEDFRQRMEGHRRRLVKASVNCAPLSLLAVVPPFADVTLENAAFRLTVGGDALVRSLVVKATGEEMLDAREPVPFVTVTQDRFFQNEIKLAYPSGETTCRANRIRREGDRLIVGFELVPYEAEIAVRETDACIGFELAGFRCPGDVYRHYKMKSPPVKSIRLLQLPVGTRANFGDWLNVMWDERAAVAVLAAEPFTKIGADRRAGLRLMAADLDRDLRLEGGKAAIVVGAGKDDFLARLDAMEREYGLPRGVRDRADDVFNSSVFWTADVTPANVDEQIAVAKRGGFRMMLVYHTAVCKSPGDYIAGDIGDYEMREEYPRGLDSLREMLAKIKAAGIRPGLHILHPFVGFNSKKYVTPVADHRLHLKKHFTVARDAGTAGGDLYVEEDPSSCPLVAEARILRFEGELLTYENFTTERPYRFTGVKRGAKGTRVAALPKGRIGGLLDVDEGGGNACFVDQDSSLQDELCDRFAELWACGFEFLCLDGCEGVNAPCQQHVANGQYRVWKKLFPKPLFTEGAAKAHFAWHHLSGANAFDVFPPETFKAMIVKWPLHEAEMMRREFSRVSFGWWGLWLPGEKLRDGTATVGTQPDMWEFGTSRAAAWDSPTTIQFSWDNLAKVRRHPRMDDLLEVMRRWEDVRARKWLTPEQKAVLRSPTQEHHLYLNERGDYELHEIEMLPTPEKAKDIRGFVFERAGRRVIAYWHTSGRCSLEVALGASGETTTVAADGIRYLTTDLPKDAAVRAWLQTRMK